MSRNSESLYVSIAEAAAIIGCSASRVYQMIKERKIKARKLNGWSWCITRIAAKDYAEKTFTRGAPRGPKACKESPVMPVMSIEQPQCVLESQHEDS